jgi:hypothetical protein
MTSALRPWFTIALFKDIPINGEQGQKKARESPAFPAIGHA